MRSDLAWIFSLFLGFSSLLSWFSPGARKRLRRESAKIILERQEKDLGCREFPVSSKGDPEDKDGIMEGFGLTSLQSGWEKIPQIQGIVSSGGMNSRDSLGCVSSPQVRS